MNSFENKSGNFINSIVDDTIVLESVIEELDSYDLDDDSVMESVFNMVMEGNPNNREDATRAGVLAAKINEKVLRSRGNDKKVERLYKIQNNITDKYDKDLPTPNGYKHNFYRNAMNGTFRKYKDRDDELNNVNVRKDTNDIVKRNRSKYYNPYKVKPKKKANEDVDGYDEFDRLVDEAIEEAEYNEAMEGLFTNEVIASVSKFKDCGMNENEARKAMKILVVFAISQGIAKKNVSNNTTELKKRDLHYITGDGIFLKSFLSKWYRIADDSYTSTTFADMLNESYSAVIKDLQDRRDQMNRVEVARAGAANVNVNNSNTSYNHASNYSKISVFESVDMCDSDVVLEALFEKRTLDTVLQAYLKQLEKKLNTVEACDKFLALIKQDQAKFNNALKVCADAKIKLDKEQIDEKQFKNLTKSAAKQIAGYCKIFKLKMSDFGGGGSSASQNITKEDIANFKQYVTGLIAGVRTIKKKRQAIVKEMDRKIGQKSTLRKDILAADEAAFDDIFIVSGIDG